MLKPNIGLSPITCYLFYYPNPSKHLDQDCSDPTALGYPQAIPIDVQYIVSHLATKHSYLKQTECKGVAAPVLNEELCLCVKIKLLKPFSFLEWFLTFQAGFKVLT